MNTNKNKSPKSPLIWFLYGIGTVSGIGATTLLLLFNGKNKIWFTLGASLLFFLSFKLAFFISPPKPVIKRRPPPNVWVIDSRFRIILPLIFTLFFLTALLLSFTKKSTIPIALEQQKAHAKQQIFNTKHDAQKDLPNRFKSNWTAFRGSYATATPLHKKFPTQWDLEMGNGIKWKTEIPVDGFNAPIVWKNRVFLTGADKLGQEVFCFDAENGELLWRKTILTAQTLPIISEEIGLATPTMTTNGKKVFALFASGDLVALDLDGEIVWRKNIGRPETEEGICSSLLCDGVRLFVQNDYKEQDKLVAFDADTGDVLWTTPRTKISLASPALVKIGDSLQLILINNKSVISYEPNTGKQIWQIQCLEGKARASIAFDGKDTLFIANKNAKPVALKLNKTSAKILWTADQPLSATASPVSTTDTLYIPTDSGKIVALDTKTGKTIWSQKGSTPFKASPLIANHTLYTFDTAGYAHLFSTTKNQKETATIKMNEPIIATPALSHGHLFIRGRTHLFCIEK